MIAGQARSSPSRRSGVSESALGFQLVAPAARPAVSPPSAVNSAPVQKLEPSLARNTTRWDSSSERPTRRIATCFWDRVHTTGHRSRDGTRMDRVAANAVVGEVEATDFVKPLRPNFDAE
jgi:hypothetical protein